MANLSCNVKINSILLYFKVLVSLGATVLKLNDVYLIRLGMIFLKLIFGMSESLIRYDQLRLKISNVHSE